MNYQWEASSVAPVSVPSVISSLVVDELIRNGIEWVVYCPGSRNGPLGFELARRAATGAIRLQVRLDERSAAFVALGISKSTSRPAAVVTTSGTAVSNLLPAVTEANYSGIPLVLVTANRPPEILGTGASQTVEQTALLTSQVRHVQPIWSGDMLRPDTNAVVRSQVCRAVGIGSGRRHCRPGPVQIDVPLSSGHPPEDPAAPFPRGRRDGEPWIRMPAQPLRPVPSYELDLRRSTIVIAGDGADLTDLPAEIPCMAEPTVDIGNRPRLHPWVLDYLLPQQVVVYGRPTLHRNVGGLLARAEVTTVLVGNGEDWIYAAPQMKVLTAQPIYRGAMSPCWDEELRAIDSTVRRQWAKVLGDKRNRHTGLGVADVVLAALRSGDVLWLGASNPIRDVSLTGSLPAGVEVLSNRGVAGIDGNISAAVGAALARPDRTVIALVGDLTFAYDASGLQFGRLEQVPDNLLIVVANDSGGGIFELLEQGDPKYKREPYGDTFERIYGTPQNVDIAHLCAAYAAAHRTVEVEALGAVLRTARGERRTVVLEVPITRAALRDLHTAARQGVDAALDSASALHAAMNALRETSAPAPSSDLEYS
ncbi:2-succinyl-5-enolpyruvyl-6-hydroxy-3-cyclohexene-1-carboxylic-acid synthase [Nocardia uniformis]|uniref:2-succinyl-5-enolpyruvyl-6-hydroxy-3-cyclohexene-1-carboxylate synthase n=1 Tax=Nocardia uniformis TaxID=53432 RepID=A0A849BSQ7_9NOCA|nr:2-succinyl-5-enolpyruvyl-6-hydroxy-3-cyclohexene-1-carboxylic-acid synthase [Nocardia uniformis]NNH69623.1 2-succinyl-5-enolpyruvyl-6-hydroxy-3-cyclohexene-1-carboxylic-acid synthase [Nocardia uniformis]